MKKYSEKALQNSVGISLSKLDWISSGYIFFIQETDKKGPNTPDTYIPEKLIMEGGKKASSEVQGV